MPAGVGAGVALADALEVLRGRQRHRGVGVAVAHDEQRQLGAGEPLLDHEGAPGVAEGVTREVGAHGVAGLGDRLGDHHALARGEAVGLHDPRRGELLEVRQRGGLVVGAEAAVARGGDARGREHLLHPRLRALEPGAGRAGAEREPARGRARRRPRPRRAGPRDR